VPKGYVTITEAIHDPAGMGAYGEVSGASLAEHGATVLLSRHGTASAE